MNWKEYLNWLSKKDKVYFEERLSEDVVRELAFHHEFDVEKAEYFPRKKVDGIEFDLIVSYKKRKNDRRLLGVEFKESDFAKVVFQAIKRRPYVDYIYVTIIPPIEYWDMTAFFELLFFGIGLVVWSHRKKDAFIVFKSVRNAEMRERNFIWDDFLLRTIKALREDFRYFDELEREVKSQTRLV